MIFPCVACAFPPYFYFRRKFWWQIRNRTPTFPILILTIALSGLVFEIWAWDRQTTYDKVSYLLLQADHLTNGQSIHARLVTVCAQSTGLNNIGGLKNAFFEKHTLVFLTSSQSSLLKIAYFSRKQHLLIYTAMPTATCAISRMTHAYVGFLNSFTGFLLSNA